MDAAGRTTIYSNFTIKIKDYIVGRPNDAAVTLVRRLLSKSGGKLIFINKGLGDLSINIGSVKDVSWGPKTQELEFEAVGRDNVCKITWEVQFCAPDCSAAKYQFAAMEFNYKLTYDIDRAGLTTRVYSGFLRVPQTKGVGPEDRRVLDSADSYREKIIPVMVEGFRRIPGEFTLDYSKSRLDFTIRDEEFPGPPPPPGVVDVTASHSVSSSSAGLHKWAGNFSATYTVAKGFNKSLAFLHFMRLVRDRIVYSKSIVDLAYATDQQTSKSSDKKINTFIVTSFGLKEPEIYGKETANFFLTYTFATSVKYIFAASGLWRAVPDSDWGEWASSMGQTLGSRGNADLRFSTGDDKLVDLCDAKVVPPKGKRLGDVQLGAGNVGDLLDISCPPPENSWLDYTCWIESEGDDGVVDIPTIPTDPLTPKKPKSNPGSRQYPEVIDLGNKAASPLWPTDLNNANTLETTIQRRTSPTVYIYLVGKAVRACYPIPRPALTKIGKVEPVAANRLDRGEGFKQGLVANVGHPVYAANWRLRYAVPADYAAKLPIPGNSLIEDGEATSGGTGGGLDKPQAPTKPPSIGELIGQFRGLSGGGGSSALVPLNF